MRAGGRGEGGVNGPAGIRRCIQCRAWGTSGDSDGGGGRGRGRDDDNDGGQRTATNDAKACCMVQQNASRFNQSNGLLSAGARRTGEERGALPREEAAGEM